MAALPSELAPVQLPVPAPSRPAPVAVPDRRRAARAARRPVRYVLAMVGLAAITIFACVALNALAAEQSFAVRELEQEVAELTRTADELTVDVTRLESPARLHRTAVQRLGMVRAEQPAFLVLPGGGSRDSGTPSSTMSSAQGADGK